MERSSKNQTVRIKRTLSQIVWDTITQQSARITLQLFQSFFIRFIYTIPPQPSAAVLILTCLNHLPSDMTIQPRTETQNLKINKMTSSGTWNKVCTKLFLYCIFLRSQTWQTGISIPHCYSQQEILIKSY